MSWSIPQPLSAFFSETGHLGARDVVEDWSGRNRPNRTGRRGLPVLRCLVLGARRRNQRLHL